MGDINIVNSTKKGKIIVFSGPSGVGKGTIIEELLNDKSLNLSFSVSATTRPARLGEENGKQYYFLSKDDFKRKIDNNEFLEHKIYADNFYGTLFSEVERSINKGINIILDLEVQGFLELTNIKNPILDTMFSIYISPPNLEELKNRLINRNKNSIEEINKRIEIYENFEINHITKYNYKIVNDDLSLTVERVKEIIKYEIKR